MGPLGDGATGDPSSGNGKRPLVEKIWKINVTIGEGFEGEEAAADEGVARGAEGESETEEVVEKGASSSVKDVGKHDVHGILGAHGASA